MIVLNLCSVSIPRVRPSSESSSRRAGSVNLHVPFLLVAIFLLCHGCDRAIMPGLVQVELYQPGSGAVPVAADSTGHYEVLPALAIVEVQFPALSQLNVLADGSVLQLVSDPTQQAGLEAQNIGFYYIGNSSVNSVTGLADYQLVVVPPLTKLQGPEVDILIEDQSIDNTNVGADLVSPPIKIALIRSSPPLGVQTVQTAAYAAIGCGFLGYAGSNSPGFVNSAQDATAYYAAIDPAGAKTTFPAWRTANGFSPTDNSLDDAYAIYYNARDLGFGRSMHMKAQNGNYAYYVSNYRSVDDARLNTNLIATVAMDYSPVAGVSNGQPFIKFYVYNQVGQLVPSADLDGCGQKFVPGLCQICHNGLGPFFSAPGGAGQQSPDVNARFLTFDLDNFEYSTAPRYGRSDQEAMFEKLNVGILNANPSLAETELIQGWYQCTGTTTSSCAASTQNSSFIPAGWANSPSNPSASSNYLNGVKPACRTCHVSQQPTPFDFDTAASFTSLRANILQRVCIATPILSSTESMPQARVTYLRFWLDPNATAPVNVLNATSPGQVGFSNNTVTVNGAGCPVY